MCDVWQRRLAHVVLLVTNGNGSVPPAMPGDKARTSAILIPPDCDPATMGQIAERVVTLSDLCADSLTSPDAADAACKLLRATCPS